MSEYNDRKIATEPTATVEQAGAWAKARGASQLMIDLAPTFWRIAKEKGINPVFSFCQTAFETGYMNYPNTLINASYKNTAGIKRSDSEIKEILKKYPGKGSDDVAECHMRFNSWEDSIKAQVDHSALYAGLAGYPKKYPSETNDPRHFDWCFGKGKTVLEWAPQYSTHHYGDKLLAMMFSLENTEGEKKPKQILVQLPQLEKGMKGASVTAMQVLLILKGFDCGEKGADGSFGGATEKAVKAFQRSLKKPDSGICGIGTWTALCN